MSSKKNNVVRKEYKDSIRIVNMSSYEIPEIKEVHNKDWVAFGNNNDYADDIALQIYADLLAAIDGKPNVRGGEFHLNMLSTTCHIYFGKVMGATPNGRLAGKSISDGTSPSHGADTNGPSAVIKNDENVRKSYLGY